jgi:hypothetical protein
MRVDVCVQFTTKNKKLFADATFLLALCARPYPLPLGSFCLLAMVLRVRVALGHLGHVAPGHFVRVAGASMAGMSLGHLGHLGHRFKLQAGASGWLALGHLGHCFLRDPNDPKAWRQRARSFKALGHLGHFVTR